MYKCITRKHGILLSHAAIYFREKKKIEKDQNQEHSLTDISFMHIKKIYGRITTKNVL